MSPMSAPPMPDAIAANFIAMPETARTQLQAVRRQIFALADDVSAGPLTETLKWGQPAYLTEKTRSGSTIRLGIHADEAAVFFNCNTTLVSSFRADFGDTLRLDGKRALLLEGSDPAAISLALTRALTYHRTKGARP